MPGRTRLASCLCVVLLAACAGTPRPTEPVASGPAPTPSPSGSPLDVPERTVDRGSPPPASGSPGVAPSATVVEIDRLSASVQDDPTNADLQRRLGSALLQRIRETGDPSLYGPAAAAFDRARTLAPDDPLVSVGIATLQLGKHQFGDALITARHAIELAPRLAVARALEVDALVELGRYDDADVAAAAMLGLASDLSTLTRVSYLAELHGKLDLAVVAMRKAIGAGEAAQDPPENIAFAEAQLGNLLAWTGDRDGAEQAYDDALRLVPAHAPSLAGKARLALANGDVPGAVAGFQHAADVLPLPEYVIALASAQTEAGRATEAARNLDLARAEIRLFQAAGVSVDLDLALFEADHGDPADALTLAQAADKATPTIRAADAVAWALHRLGRDREARPYAARALRLGSVDPTFRFHAGAIEAALGDDRAARHDLEGALTTDPGFSATGAAEARLLLATLRD
jgi:tetratricopeptide (TPR) repeat protein